MIDERHAQVKELFLAAAALAGEERAVLLAEACGGDDELRREVESLLAFHDADASREEPGPPPAPSLLPGQQVSHYTIVRRLGAGGMGEVFEARDRKLERHVAIKFLHPWVAGDERMRARFRREARAASALSHPNICTVHDIDESEGRLFLVMELLRGGALCERLAGEPLEVAEVVGLGLQIGAALEAAHAAGIVHRDVKPGNIFVDRAGRVKLLDFGLALRGPAAERLTTEHGLIGTVAYMSPEQARGEQLDARSDLFSFGIVLYEMATGRLPFGGNGSPWRQLADLAERTPVAPRRLNSEIPVALDLLIRRALEKEPAARYPAAAALLADLGRLREGGPVSSAPTELMPTAGPPPPSPLPARGRTPFVGRESERSELGYHLQRAANGRGTVVFIGGEAGVGKTRLASELAGDARRLGMRVLAGYCREMEVTPPFLPFAEALEALARAVPQETLAEIVGVAGACATKIAPRLRSWLPAQQEELDLPPEQERLHLFNGLIDLLDRAARRLPLLLVLEDLHWADSSSLLLLRHAAPRFAELPILVVGTFRDFEVGLDHPLAGALEELLAKHLGHRMALGLLAREPVHAILSALGGESAPSSISRRIYGVTEGNPFFVEEVFDHLAEEELLFDRQGRWRDDVAVDELKVPESVGLLLGRRLERLDETSQQVLTSAAVVGRRFGFQLLEGLLSMDAAELLDALDEAESTRLIESHRSGSEILFSFSHALIRKTLLGRLSLLRRQLLHLQVASALEDLHGEDPAAAADLAYHLEQAGSLADAGKAVHYLELAARQALSAAAFEDALRLLRKAIAALGSLPESDERIQRELGLQMAALVPLSAVEGYCSESAEQLFEQLEALSRKAGSEVPHELAVGICRFSTVRGKIRTAAELTEQLLEGATRDGDRARLVDAHRSLGCSLYFLGKPVAARTHLEKALGLFREDPAACRPDDPGLEDLLVYLTSHLGWTYWLLGSANRALAMTAEGIETARELEQPFSLVHALLFDVYVRQCSGQRRATREQAEEMGAVALEHTYPMFVAAAESAVGWSQAASGELTVGIERMQGGLEAWMETGAGVAVPYYRIQLAEALGRAGRIEEALSELDRAHAQIAADGEGMCEAELARLRGELILEMSAPNGAAREALQERAESLLRRALEIARTQGARALELRAASSWLRFRLGHEEEAAARASLGRLCEGLAEGGETADLVAARELLG